MRVFRSTWSFLIAALIGGAFYFLLIDITGVPELWTLAGVAVGCGVTGALSREQGFVEAQILPWWVLRSWRLLYQIPRDIGILCSEALSQLVAPRTVRGEFRATRFDAVEQTPQAMGRRALAEVMGAVSPNSIVVGIDDERGLLLVHQLRRHGPAKDLDVTGLG